MKFKKKQREFTRQNFAKQNLGGFTLVEVLVSVSLFVMTMIVLSQIYISVIRSERIAYALLNSENNIRNSLEIMARSIRVGKEFQILSDNKELCFDYPIEGDWEKYCYRFDNDTIERSHGSDPYMSMLDPSLEVKYGRFYNKGGSSNSQSVIIIVLEVSTSIKQQEYLFNLQTAVTPRSLGEAI